MHHRTYGSGRRSRRWFSRRVGFLGVILAVGSVLAGTALADPHDDKRRVQRELSKARSTLEAATDKAQAAAAAYEKATRELPAAQDRLAEARGQVAAAEVAAERAREDLGRAETALDSATMSYRAMEDEVTTARERMSGFVSAAYKGGGIVAFNSIVTARSPSDLADRLAFLDDVAATQQTALDRVVQLRHQAKERQNDAEAARRRAAEAEQAAEDTLAEAEAAQDAAEQAAADVADLVEQRERALSTAKDEREASLKRYRELERESERIKADIRGMADKDRASDAPQRKPGARFVMPTYGWKSSDFGRRWDPYYKVWQLHAGVDFAAAGGSAVRAADSGRVFRAGWNGGYGKYTCIYHGLSRGDGLATCYAHQSRILVSDGERVSRGEIIGRVGTTGASTGDHLHFEVRLDGTPVDPLPWLPRCLC